MPDSHRRQLLLLVAALVSMVPVAFAVVRASNTGEDFRYFWLAAAAILGSLVVMVPAYRGRGSPRVPAWRAAGAITAGAACAAAAAIVLGGTPGPGLAIVAVAFGLCTGTGMLLGAVAMRRGDV
jgi:peptidoglycan/LPS O-acetylase OafA/YrhL